MRLSRTDVLSIAVVTLLLCGLLVGRAVLADRPLGTVTSSSAGITHGDWRRLPDAGFHYTVCGSARLTDGGIARLPEDDCEICTPGGWNAAIATCVAQWKANRGL